MVVVVLQSFGHGESEPVDFSDAPSRFSDGFESTSSTPFVSAPSSPGRGSSSPASYFFSAPSSPMHFVLYSTPSSSSVTRSTESEFPKHDSSSSEFEFDFSSRLSSSSGCPLDGGSMISADELFSNGQIKSLKPQILAPLLDLETEEEEDFNGEIVRGRDLKLRRCRSVHGKARSLSPLRNAAFQCEEENETKLDDENKTKSKSLTEPSDDSTKSPATGGGKPTNGVAKRRGLKPSAHELHYTTNRAQAEEMKKRTYLPYRHGLFGCLGFSSKGYNALNGLTRSLNTVSSR
ncbi:unnamed protein product [Arabis nemorensis]|uniref:Uncharacterized protein n=1 Tax=Arabis nemorensis TaxID=586526 RepID=A0A565BQH2_9BRAS|nr:unnamed protein product [Arabis nemorensis]